MYKNSFGHVTLIDPGASNYMIKIMWYGVWYELCAFLGFRIVVDYVKNSCWLHNLRARRNWNSSLMNFNHFNKSAKNLWNFSCHQQCHQHGHQNEFNRYQHYSPKLAIDIVSILYCESSVNWPSLFCGNPVHLQNELLCSRTVLWKTKRNYPCLILTDKKYFHQNISKYKKNVNITSWIYVGKRLKDTGIEKLKYLVPSFRLWFVFPK